MQAIVAKNTYKIGNRATCEILIFDRHKMWKLSLGALYSNPAPPLPDMDVQPDMDVHVAMDDRP